MLWVADIGDNNARRTRGILVHRVEEPATLRDRTVEVRSFRLRYPDGPRDAETLLVEPGSGRLLVVSKELLGGAVYAAPERLDGSRPNVLERLAGAPAVVTDGAFLPDGRLALRTYSRVLLSAGPGKPAEEVGLPDQEQGESLAAEADGRSVLVGSEGRRSTVWRVPLPATPAPERSRAGGRGAEAPNPVSEARERVGRLSPGAVALGGVLGVVALVGVAVAAGRRRRTHTRW